MTDAVVNTTCGNCRYYVERPPEVRHRCSNDGVCLRCGRSVNSSHYGHMCACNSTFNIGDPKRATHWTDMEDRLNRCPGCDGCRHKGTPNRAYTCRYCSRMWIYKDMYEPKDNDEREE